MYQQIQFYFDEFPIQFSKVLRGKFDHRVDDDGEEESQAYRRERTWNKGDGCEE